MRITERDLRELIRKEIAREENLNEVSIDPLSVGTALTGVAINYFRRKIMSSRIKSMAIEFINKSPELFGLRKGGFSRVAKSIQDIDFDEWVSLSDQLKNFTNRNVVGIENVKRGVNSILATMNINEVKKFNSSDARNLFFSEGFRFDADDLSYLKTLYRYSGSSNRNYNNNHKSRVIDVLFTCMVHLYCTKYSSAAKRAKAKAEKSLSKIIGVPIVLDPASKKGVQSRLIRLDKKTANSLSNDQIIKFAEVFGRYGDRLHCKAYIPYSVEKTRGIDTVKIQSEVSLIVNKWEFLTSVASSAKKAIKMMSGSSAGVGGVINFLSLLSRECAKDEANKAVVENIIESIEESNIKSLNIKEFLKFFISIILG